MLEGVRQCFLDDAVGREVQAGRQPGEVAGYRQFDRQAGGCELSRQFLETAKAGRGAEHLGLTHRFPGVSLVE